MSMSNTPFEQPCPADAAGARLDCVDLAFGGGWGFVGLFCLNRLLRHHQRP
jgi:hypothetical protein